MTILPILSNKTSNKESKGEHQAWCLKRGTSTQGDTSLIFGHSPEVLRENEKIFVQKVSSYKPVNVSEGRFSQLHLSIDELNVLTTTTRTH